MKKFNKWSKMSSESRSYWIATKVDSIEDQYLSSLFIVAIAGVLIGFFITSAFQVNRDTRELIDIDKIKAICAEIK